MTTGTTDFSQTQLKKALLEIEFSEAVSGVAKEYVAARWRGPRDGLFALFSVGFLKLALRIFFKDSSRYIKLFLKPADGAAEEITYRFLKDDFNRAFMHAADKCFMRHDALSEAV